MSRMSAVYYRDAAGHEPVAAFIDALPVERQAAVDDDIDMLNRMSPLHPPLAFPRSSQVEGELRELRCTYGREQYRVLYRRSHNLFILLQAFGRRDAQSRIVTSRRLMRGGEISSTA